MRFHALPPLFLTALALLAGGCGNKAAARLGTPPQGRALWVGDWSSDEYGMIGGRVAVLLPDPLPDAASPRATFNVPAAIEYGGMSLYRAGQVQELSLQGAVRDGRAGGDNAARPVNAPPPRLLLFSKGEGRGEGSTGRQVIEYDAAVPTGDTIRGHYRSTGPQDAGWFRLKRRQARQSPSKLSPST